MAQSNGYGVELGFNFTSFETVNKEYQTILKRLSNAGQIKVGASWEKADLLNIQNEFKQIVNQKITFDSNDAKTEIKTLRNSANELLTIINKFNNQGELLSTSYNASSKAQLEAQTGIYKELNKLQTTEFNLKKQMITAEGGHYNELSRQLEITKQLQSSTGKVLNSNGLTSEKETNNLIQNRIELQNKLNSSVEKQVQSNINKYDKADLKAQEDLDKARQQSTQNNLARQQKEAKEYNRMLNEKYKYEQEEKQNREKLEQEGLALYEQDELKKTQIARQEQEKRSKLEQEANDKYNKLFNNNDRTAKSELSSASSTIKNLENNGLYNKNFINSLKEELNSLNIDTPINKIREFKTYVNSLDGGNEGGIVKLQKAINDYTNKLEALKGKYKGLVPEAELNEFSSLLDKLRVKSEGMKNGDIIDSRKLSSEIDDVKDSFDKLNNATKESSSGFKTGNQDVRSFGESLKSTATSMGLYLSSAVAFQKIFQTFREAVEYTKTMDKGMTNIQMITGETASQVADTVKQYKQLGAELHVTNAEIIGSSEELLRAGYSAEEAKKMMSASLIGSKVSGQTAESVTEQLIAMKNAFGLSADSMEHYVDVISKMDNTSATSFAEIANAVQRTAYSAQQSGTELDTLITYITTVSEKTRKPAETIGESFKTIYARYSNIKLGNLDEDGKSINDTEKAMARVGIQIRDSKDSFREFDDVLQEFMTKYKSGQLSQVDYLAGVQALAGTRFNFMPRT